MSNHLATVGPGHDGIAPFDGNPIVVKATNRSGATLAVGECAAFDIALTDFANDVTNFKIGDPNSAWRNLVALDAKNTVDGMATIAMALESTINDADGRFLLRGFVPIKWQELSVASIIVLDGGAGVETARGDRLIAVSGQQELDVDPAATGRVVGYTTTLDATIAIALPIPVFFNGIDWLGTT
jgi:hypothetical protein